MECQNSHIYVQKVDEKEMIMNRYDLIFPQTPNGKGKQ